MLAVLVIVAVVFGLLGAAAAFVITYAEYERHKLPARRLIAESLRTAIVALLVLVAVAVLGGLIVSRCQR